MLCFKRNIYIKFEYGIAYRPNSEHDEREKEKIKKKITIEL